jgi:two-component system, OmpR family, response regulator
MRILLVEDDSLLAMGLQEGLKRNGFVVRHETSAEGALSALRQTTYDAVIVDIGLPEMDGLELIRRCRQQGMLMPVMILTARDALEDRVTGLDLGADDYLIKPVQLAELLARLRALIRRARSATASELAAGTIRLYMAARYVTVDGRLLELAPREYEILEQLILSIPKVVSKRQLVESLGASDHDLTPNAIEAYVSRLRAKLAGSGVEIRTLRGIGYRLDETGPDRGHA